MQKKVDRRVRKTKSQLRKGLARLLQEKSIGEITVKELVEEVDINRSTFYLHYSDIPSLLKEIEDDMMDEMERAVREHPIQENSTGRFIEDIFRSGPSGNIRSKKILRADLSRTSFECWTRTARWAAR